MEWFWYLFGLSTGIFIYASTMWYLTSRTPKPRCESRAVVEAFQMTRSGVKLPQGERVIQCTREPHEGGTHLGTAGTYGEFTWTDAEAMDW